MSEPKRIFIEKGSKLINSDDWFQKSRIECDSFVEFSAYEQAVKQRDELIERINVVCEARQAMGDAYVKADEKLSVALEALKESQRLRKANGVVSQDDFMRGLRRLFELQDEALAKIEGMK